MTVDNSENNTENSTSRTGSQAGLRAEPLADMAARLADSQKLLGLDISKRAIGVAVSDGARRLAVPLCVLTRRQGDAQATADKLKALSESHRVGGLIVGLPLTESGDMRVRVRSVRGVMRSLVLLGLACPWSEWDERHSTQAVVRTGFQAEGVRGKRNHDAEAATWILQGALDWLNREQ